MDIIKNYQEEKMWHEHDFNDFIDFVKYKLDLEDNEEVQNEVKELEAIAGFIRDRIISAEVIPKVIDEFGDRITQIRLRLEYEGG
jgi:hypothetical protein